MKDYFFLAFNNLRRRKLRAWLTILGIFIGIAAVVALISLGQGLREAVTGNRIWASWKHINKKINFT